MGAAANRVAVAVHRSSKSGRDSAPVFIAVVARNNGGFARVVFGLNRALYAGLDCQYSSARKIIRAWFLTHNAVIHNAQTNFISFDSV